MATMTIEDLQKKVEAAELKVEKCRKTIQRHEATMDKKALQLQRKGVNPELADKYAYAQQNTQEANEIYWLLCDYEHKKDDIKNAGEKLQDAERICNGWKEKLDLQINREKVIQDQVPQVIKDFLQDWKEKCFDWYVIRHARYLEVKADLRQQVRAARIEAIRTLPEFAETKERWEKNFGSLEQIDDHWLINAWPREVMDKFLKEKHLDHKAVQEKLSWIGDRTILKMCEFRKEGERLAWLDKQLEAEKKAHLMWFVENVTSITGPITDAKGLHISGGDLNGLVLGEKGAAIVNTFSAGGWNIQRFHFRTRIDDVTEKVMGNPPEKKQSLDEKIHAAAGKQSVSSSHTSPDLSSQR